YMNRLQNRNDIMYADARTGNVRTILTEKEAAWVDLSMPQMKWIDGGKRFLWLSDRDGWQHVYSISRDGGDVKLITPGAFDVVDIKAVDEKGGWLYYSASPANATQLYLFRTSLSGGGAAERIT